MTTDRSPKATFCSVPFTHLNTNPAGEVRVCCYVETPIGNFHKAKLEDIWHSKRAKQIRESIYDQSFKFCDKEFCSVAAKADASAIRDASVRAEIEELRGRY